MTFPHVHPVTAPFRARPPSRMTDMKLDHVPGLPMQPPITIRENHRLVMGAYSETVARKILRRGTESGTGNAKGDVRETACFTTEMPRDRWETQRALDLYTVTASQPRLTPVHPRGSKFALIRHRPNRSASRRRTRARALGLVPFRVTQSPWVLSQEVHGHRPCRFKPGRVSFLPHNANHPTSPNRSLSPGAWGPRHRQRPHLRSPPPRS